MKGMLTVFASIALTAFCWGVYGPALHAGKAGMGGEALLPFVCVGLAYFGIAVAAPAAWLFTQGEKGSWSLRGTVWSLLAGAAGALGALGIIMALKHHGNPIYVMPLVFGGAPVVNTFFTMATSRTFKAAGPVFFAGLILVIAGASTVLFFKPAGSHGPAAELSVVDFVLVGVWVSVTAVSWGVYGPVLHWGQSAMAGSRLRPFLCVGLAYFLVAVLIPAAILAVQGVPDWTPGGAAWSLAGGAAGAVGALGIIMAFNFGGKPIYVMPLVFGVAPVVNTFTTMAASGVPGEISPLFYAGLILVAAGAATVLIFAPKSGPPVKAPPPAAPSTEMLRQG